jgi:hypothetical protein
MKVERRLLASLSGHLMKNEPTSPSTLENLVEGCQPPNNRKPQRRAGALAADVQRSQFWKSAGNAECCSSSLSTLTLLPAPAVMTSLPRPPASRPMPISDVQW